MSHGHDCVRDLTKGRPLCPTIVLEYQYCTSKICSTKLFPNSSALGNEPPHAVVRCPMDLFVSFMHKSILLQLTTITTTTTTELNPSELAPLDAFGNPKYKGRKRGRKPKKRKRALNPNRQKRQHTAYTLFVHEVYPTIRAQYQDTDYQSKDIIGLVARQWATISEAEKRVWKERALASHQDTVDVDEEDGDNEDDEDDEDDELQQDEEVEEEVPVAKPKRGRPRKKV